MAWLMLAVAIVAEVAATLSMRSLASGLSPIPLVISVIGYLVSFTLMALTLRTLNVGTVYAIWSSLGTAGVVVAASVLYREQLNATSITGMAIIILGVVVLVSSGSVSHS